MRLLSNCIKMGLWVVMVVLITVPVTNLLAADGPQTGSLIRFQYSSIGGDTYENRISSFDLVAVRPHWKGKMLDGRLTYKLLLDFDKNFSKPGVLDAYGEYKLVNRISVRFGQFKVPFDRQFLTPLSAMQFIDRGAGGLKVFKRDRGVTMFGSVMKGLINYDLGIFNGTGTTTNFNAKNKSGRDSQQHLFAGRISFDPMGEYGYKLAVPGKTEGLKTTLGFGVASGQINDDSTDVTAFSVDVTGRAKGLSMMVEYQNREMKTPAKVTTSGFTGQTGYCIFPQLETVGRFSTQKIKNGAAKNEITLGINYYFDGNNAKLQLNYVRQEIDNNADIKPVDQKVLLLYQLVF